jgi:hypothetical protein
VARRLSDELERHVAQHHLAWTLIRRPGWFSYQRVGRFIVAAVEIRRDPVQFSVKLPANPEQLGLDNPYPQLNTWWDDENRQWTWAVPTLHAVPDITPAVNLSREFQPETGAMRAPERLRSHSR